MKSLRKGFTLVELMVVIVIIGILAALAIPRFLGATNKAKVTEFKPVLKQIYTLETAYQQESSSGSYGTLQQVGWDAPGKDNAGTKTSAYFNYGLGKTPIAKTVTDQTNALTVAVGKITAGNALANGSPNDNGEAIKGADGTALKNGTDMACVITDGSQAAVGTAIQSLVGAAVTGTTCP